MIDFKKMTTVLGLALTVSSCDFIEDIEAKSAAINKFEKVSLRLAKENKSLISEKAKLKGEIAKLKAQNSYLKLKLEGKADQVHEFRVPASISPQKKTKTDFKVYKWSDQELYRMGSDFYKNKDYKKAFHYYKDLSTYYPKSKLITDVVLLEAGVSAYESKQRPKESLYFLEKLINDYPTSPLYRQAKLWRGMNQLAMGNNDAFFTTVEEFRKKYRNTNEWKLLSVYYERIVQNYKE